MTETMTIAQLITESGSIVASYQAIIWVTALVGVATLLFRRIRSAAR